MNRDSATALEPQLLTVAMTKDDMFPDPNLFSGSGNSAPDTSSSTRNKTDSSSMPETARNRFLLPTPTLNKGLPSEVLRDEERGLSSLPSEIVNADIPISGTRIGFSVSVSSFVPHSMYRYFLS